MGKATVTDDIWGTEEIQAEVDFDGVHPAHTWSHISVRICPNDFLTICFTNYGENGYKCSSTGISGKTPISVTSSTQL